MAKKCKVRMSIPKGMEFGVKYEMDHTLHNEHYWDVNRNIDAHASEGEIEISEGEVEILPFDQHLDEVIKEISDLLKIKNKAYGNTALNPTNVFSKLSSTEAICARLDDKLARIQNKGINDQTEDTVDDLIGYLLLLKMSL